MRREMASLARVAWVFDDFLDLLAFSSSDLLAFVLLYTLVLISE